MFVSNTNCAVSLHNTFSKSPLTSSFIDLEIFVFFFQVCAPKPYMYPSLYAPLRFLICPVNASTLIRSPY